MNRRFHLSIVSVALFASACLASGADDLSELKAELALLKQQVSRLEAKLESGAAPPPSAYWSGGKNVAEPMDDIDAAYMGSGSGARWSDQTSLGGYGEMHMNFNDGADDQIDFHRWVLFLNHEFTDNIKFVSELEIEHSVAGEGKNGEVELEQAYIDFGLSNGFSVKGGLFLLPIGITNETHEPTTFFGTERNNVEKEIIPTTWWEGGAAVTKQFEETGLQLDFAVHSGLNVPFDGKNAFRIRSGRQKVSEANGNEWATTGRVRYAGIPGLEIASSVQYQSDITPGIFSEKNDAWLGEAHIDFRRGGFGMRALATYWKINGDTPETLGLDEQWGYYLEPSYTFTMANGSKLGFFTRYSRLDSALGESTQWDAGLN
ncbi:MAG: hypothetical protein ACI9DF_001528, partial [Verrucomicrobiales bacterium]